jgi:hypothetical protein
MNDIKPETDIERLDRLYKEEKEKLQKEYFKRSIWFRISFIFLVIIFSFTVALPYLFSGPTEFVIGGIIYLIVVPYLVWVMNKTWFKIVLKDIYQ